MAEVYSVIVYPLQSVLKHEMQQGGSLNSSRCCFIWRPPLWKWHIKQTVALYRSKYVGCSFFCRGRYCCIDQVMSPVLDVHGLIVSSIDWFLQPVAKKIYTLKDIICHFLKKINLESFGDQIKKKFNINKQKEIDRTLCPCFHVIQFIYSSV